MGLVETKCMNCGANITIDNTSQSCTCGHCGTVFVTEKVIHNTYVNNNITVDGQVDISKIQLIELKRQESKLEQLYKTRDMDAIQQMANEMIEKYPTEYFGYKYSLLSNPMLTEKGTDKYAEFVKFQGELRVCGGVAVGYFDSTYRKMIARMTEEDKKANADFLADAKKIVEEYRLSIKAAARKYLIKSSLMLILIAILTTALALVCMYTTFEDHWYGSVVIVIFSLVMLFFLWIYLTMLVNSISVKRKNKS